MSLGHYPAPSADCFPAYPQSWYLFGRSQELTKKPMGKDMLGRRIVVFRTESGQLKAMDATCSHLGADLSLGCVAGESIRCPYHGWEYGVDGRCSKIPGAKKIHEGARQKTFAVAERHGLIFVFNGPVPLFPLPFFNDESPGDFVAGRPFQFNAPCSWYLLASHAFDTQHFASVHDRRLLAPPVVDCPAPYARRNLYSAEVVGQNMFDKALRTFAGKTVSISITTWGGTLFFLTGSFKRAASCFMIAVQPVSANLCSVEGICYARRSGSALSDAIGVPMILALRRFFTHGYLLHESALLGSPKYQPWSLVDTETDRELINYFNWQAGLVPSESASQTELTSEASPRVYNGAVGENPSRYRHEAPTTSL